MNKLKKGCEDEVVLDRSGLDPTLLRFATPLLVTEDEQMMHALATRSKHRQLTQIYNNETSPRIRVDNKNLQDAIKRHRAATKGTVIRKICMDDYSHAPSDAVVQLIHSPRKWARRGKKCTQKISNDCTIRKDVIALKKTFDERLNEFGIDQVGLCRRRKECLDQLFDEIIRQVMMSCVERGQLLLKVRDEMNKLFGCFESLFFSAIAYGIKGQMRAQKNAEDWREKIDEIRDKIHDLEVIQDEFIPAYTHFEDVFMNQLDVDTKEYTQNYEKLQRNHGALKELLLSAVKDPTSDTDLSVQNVPAGRK